MSDRIFIRYNPLSELLYTYFEMDLIPLDILSYIYTMYIVWNFKMYIINLIRIYWIIQSYPGARGAIQNFSSRSDFIYNHPYW